MRLLSVLLWSLVGLISASAGYLAGDLLGSFWPQTVVATAAAGVALGLLSGQRRLIVIAAGAAAVVSLLAFFLGTLAVTPMIAWPLAGLTLGLAAWPAIPSRRARIGAAVSGLVLGGVGFACGSVLLALAGLGWDNSRWAAQFMLGGAAGFGFLVLAGLRVATWRASR